MNDDTLAFTPAFTERILDPEMLHSRARISIEKLQDNPDFLIMHIRQQAFREQLPTEVIAETAPRAVEFAHFATWWDHFKATYRGRWWMSWRKWEINYRTERREFTARVVVNLERWHVYPDPHFEVPELGKQVRFMRPRVNWIGWMD